MAALTNDPNLAGEKICFVCRVSGDRATQRFQYHIYIIDLSAGDDTNQPGFDLPVKSPTFTFDDENDFPRSAICALGSTLYMFDDQSNKPGRGRQVYKYELPSDISDVENYKLERHMLSRIPPMHSLKHFPVAIATPDKKNILVFSGDIWGGHPGHEIDFEMFDPDGNDGVGLWHKFAGIPECWKDGTMYNDHFDIDQWAFMDQHVVLFKASCPREDNLMFTLDLRYPNKLCQRLPRKSYKAPREWYQFIIIVGGHLQLASEIEDEIGNNTGDEVEDGDENETEDDTGNETGNEIDEDDYLVVDGDYLSLAPKQAYDAGNKVLYYPELHSLGHGDEQFGKKDIIQLYLDNSECKFCIVQSGLNHKTNRYGLIIDVYKLDIQEYKNLEKEKQKLLPATYKIKSFSISLNIEVEKKKKKGPILCPSLRSN